MAKSLEVYDSNNIYIKAHNLFEKRIRSIPKLEGLERNLRFSMLPISYDLYLSALLLFSIIGFLAGLGSGIAAVIIMNIPLYLKIALPVLTSILGAVAAAGISYAHPAMLAASRKRMITEELPYFMSYMSMLAASGMIPEAMFRVIAKEDSNEALVNDAKRIIRNIDLLGMDLITSLRDIISRSPLKEYSELLEGIISTIKVGGDMKEFFTSTSKVVMEEKKLSVKRFGETLGLLAEIYTILLVVFPLMAMIMLAIMAIMSKDLGGIDIILAMNLLAYVLVPLAGIMVMFIIGSIMPKR